MDGALNYGSFGIAGEAVQSHRDGNPFDKEKATLALAELDKLCGSGGNLFFRKTPEGMERQQAIRWALTEALGAPEARERLPNLQAVFDKMCQARRILRELSDLPDAQTAAAFKRRRKRLEWIAAFFGQLLNYEQWLNRTLDAAE